MRSLEAAFGEQAQRGVDVAIGNGASYADARVLDMAGERCSVRDGEVEGVIQSTSIGIGLRVIADGCWGFAATRDLDATSVEAAARLALQVARSGALLGPAPPRLAPVDPTIAFWSNVVMEDPFAVALEEKIALLVAATLRMRSVPGVSVAEAGLAAWRRHSLLVTSEGSRIEQRIVQCGGGIEATAVGESEAQNRSYPNSFGGDFGTEGFELIRRLDLVGNAERVGREAVMLLHAPPCPSGVTTVVLDGSQVALQVHESIGHPIELDRVLGMEAAYAGTSFLTPSDVGRLRYGSPQLHVVADATTPGALGTFGFDDEGVAAGCTPIVSEGVLTGMLTSRELAGEIGMAHSGATVRAQSWAHLPMIRMTNVSLLPGSAGSLDELLDGVDDGLYLETNRSWSIDDRRVDFQFGTEWAREIKGGRLGRVVRNATYTGRTLAFWASLDAVGGPDLWRAWGLPNCGKGQPPQIGYVAHGAAPARFRNVQVGTP
ncbi:MAG: TldD/PmbA family protein [Acidimicrobiales bacterium]